MDPDVDHPRVAGGRGARGQRPRRGALVAVPVGVIAMPGPVDALDVDRRRHRRRPRGDVLEDARAGLLRRADRPGHARHVFGESVRLREAGIDRALRVVALHELHEAVVGPPGVYRHETRGDAERVHLTRTILEDVGTRLLVGVVLRHDVVDEVRLDGDGDQVLDDVRELVGDGERLNLSPRNLLRRRAVQRFRTEPRLVEQLGIKGANRRRGGLDAGRVDRRRRRRIEARLDQRGAGQHQQLRVVLRFDFRVRHARQELDPAVHDDASDVAGGAREEHAIGGPGAAERRSIALPVLLLVGRLRLGQQQAAVGEYPPRQQPGVERLRLGARQRRERLRVLEGESERQRRLPLPGRKRDAVGIVGWDWGRPRGDRTSSGSRTRRCPAAAPPRVSRCARSRADARSRDWDRDRRWSSGGRRAHR